MSQVWEDFKLPLALSNNVCNDKKPFQLHTKAVNRFALPRQYPRTKLRTTNIVMTKAAIAPNTVKRKWDSV